MEAGAVNEPKNAAAILDAIGFQLPIACHDPQVCVCVLARAGPCASVCGYALSSRVPAAELHFASILPKPTCISL